MAFNGAGVFNRLYNWVNDAAANIKIRADRMDAEMDGIATGLSTAITKNGQTTITANLPMATFRHTGVGDAVNLTDYASFSQLRKTSLYSATVGGTADVITLTNSPAFTAYVAGMEISWIASGANTTNVTLNVDTLGAKAVTKNGSTALVANDIPSGGLISAKYDGTRFQLMSAATGGSVTGDVTISGGVSTIGAGKVTEAMQVLADNTTQNVTSTKHGYAPKSPADATKFLNGAATNAYAAVKDSDLAFTDVTTNNASTSAHGFMKKLSNVATEFMNGTGSFSVPSGNTCDLQTFVANGTWTKPASALATSKTTFRVWDGGASGACRLTTGSSTGGAGGAFAEITVPTSILSATETMTVAASAAGVSGNSNGVNGNQSSITIAGVTYLISTTSARAGVNSTATNIAAPAGGVVDPTYAKGISGGAGSAADASGFPQAVTSQKEAGVGGAGSCSSAGGTRTAGTSIQGTGGVGGATNGAGVTPGSGAGCGGGGTVQNIGSGSGSAGRIEVYTTI